MRACRAPRRPGSRCPRAARRRPRRRARSAAASARSARRAGPSCDGRAPPACRPAPCSRRRGRRRRLRSPKSSPLTARCRRRARRPGVRAIRSSSSRRPRWAAIAKRPYSTKEPGSTRSSMFSRAVRPPAAWRRSHRLGPRRVRGQRLAPPQLGKIVPLPSPASLLLRHSTDVRREKMDQARH